MNLTVDGTYYNQKFLSGEELLKIAIFSLAREYETYPDSFKHNQSIAIADEK